MQLSFMLAPTAGGTGQPDEELKASAMPKNPASPLKGNLAVFSKPTPGYQKA
jgi:hypothetical protein